MDSFNPAPAPHPTTLRPDQRDDALDHPRVRWPWGVVAIVLAGEFLDLLDALVTSVAGPTIAADLGGSPEFLQWLAASYTVAMAAGLLVGGRLGDIYGTRQMFLVGIFGFTAASLAAAVATSPSWLIGARAAQGVMGAVMIPQAFGLIRATFPPDKVGTAFSATGPVLALGGVGGPIFAGWIVDADFFDLGWRIIFAINVPVGILLLIAGHRVLPRTAGSKDVGLDAPGALVAGLGMAGLVYGLVHGREQSWSGAIIGVLVVSLALLACFARLEARQHAKGLPTLVTPGLFTKPAFTSGLAIGALFFGAVMGSSLVLALFYQLGLGMTPVESGLALAPQALGMIVGFVLAQALGLTRRSMRMGLATVIGGLTGCIATLQLTAIDPSVWWLLPSLTIVGVGLGLAVAPFFDIVLAGVAVDETGSASGALTAVQQLGNAVGVALLGSIYFAATAGADPSSGHVAGVKAALGAAAVMVTVAYLATALLPREARQPETDPVDETGA